MRSFRAESAQMDLLEGIRIFACVVETHNFSAAGRRLGISPSSVSRQIGDLEDELGARLFHRTTRKISLTEAGSIYRERAAQILMEVDEAKLAVSELGGTPSGILRVTLPASVGRMHIVPALAAFRGRYPAVQVTLNVTDRIVDVVGEGFDLAIRVGRPQDSSLVAKRVGRARRVVCAAPAYLKECASLSSPEELVDHECALFRTHPGANVWRFKRLRQTVEVRVSGSIVANDGEALVAAAEAGLGLILMPLWLVGPSLEAGRLKEVLQRYTPVPEDTPLYAMYPHQRYLAPKVRAFVDFLGERFGNETHWDGSAR